MEVYEGQPVPNGYTARLIMRDDEDGEGKRLIAEVLQRDAMGGPRWVEASPPQWMVIVTAAIETLMAAAK